MSFVDRNKYLVRINTINGDTISVLNLNDTEFSCMVDMWISFNCCSFHENGFNTSYLTYFEKPFDTQKEAIQYYKEHKDEIEWRAFTNTEPLKENNSEEN